MNKEEVGNGRLKTIHPMRYARQDDVSSVRRLIANKNVRNNRQ